MSGKLSVTVDEYNIDLKRLDKILSEATADYSRARLQALIQDGNVSINGIVHDNPSQKMKLGDVIDMIEPPPVESTPQPENIPLNIVYEDSDLLVINKPAGLVVHPGAGNPNGTLVNALLHHCKDSLSGIGGVLRPGIVHRLDKDTSGLIIVAKNDKAHHGLSDQLQDRSLSREYLALVLKVPQPPRGFVDASIGRDARNRQKMAVQVRGGKEARTHYHVQKRFGQACSLVACKLETGRTHQIRVHMASIKHPLIGDPLYGPQQTQLQSTLRKEGYEADVVEVVKAFPRQALHARKLAFIHPITGEQHEYQADMPDDMRDLIATLSN